MNKHNYCIYNLWDLLFFYSKRRLWNHLIHQLQCHHLRQPRNLIKSKKNITHQHFFHNFWSISGKFTDFLKGAKRRAGMVAGFEVWKRELDSTFIIQFIPNSKMIGMNICRIKTPKIKILKLTRKCSKYKQNVYEVARS